MNNKTKKKIIAVMLIVSMIGGVVYGEHTQKDNNRVDSVYGVTDTDHISEEPTLVKELTYPCERVKYPLVQ